jgi:hypothetical protein
MPQHTPKPPLILPNEKLPAIPATTKEPHHNSRIKRRQLKPLDQLNLCTNKSSGQYIHDKRPELYRRIVSMLAAPEHSFRDITKATGISWPTLRAIYEREAPSIDEERAILRKKYARLERLLIERVEQHAEQDDMKARDYIFGISVVHDKRALLSGEATSHNLNYNVTAAVDIAGEFNKLHDAIVAKAEEATTPLPSEPLRAVRDSEPPQTDST